MPDLICFQVGERELIHEPELGVQGGIQGNEGFVSILPDGRAVRDVCSEEGCSTHHAE